MSKSECMMKTMMKSIAVFLAVVLVAGLCIWMPVKSLAAGESIVAEQVGAYSVSVAPQDITIRITISGVSDAYCGFYIDGGISLPEGWSLKEYTTSNTAQPVTSSDYNPENGKLNYATDDVEDSIPANTYYDAVVTAPANASGSYHITFNDVNCAKTYGTITLASAASVTAEVIIEETTYPSEAYFITVSSDKAEVKVDDAVTISFDVTNSSADAFNAFYGTLYYDSAAFSYSEAYSRVSGFMVDDSIPGTLEIYRAGSDVPIPGSGPELSLTFTAEAVTESAAFILRNARVDMADKANGDAAAAVVSGVPSVKVTAKGGDGDKLHVTMRLIGAELANKDVDLGTTRYLPNYVTWIPTTSYDLDKGSTVYDLWVMATENAGIRSVGADKNYVKTVYAPDALGGYALSEFTNGRRSGWMYTINGKHPGYGLKEQALKDGDVVIWHYVNDYSYEVDDWFSEGQWQALGDGTYWNRWLLAPDYFGGKGGGLSENSDDSEDGERSGVVIYIPAKDGPDTVTVPDDKFEEAVEEALKTGEKQIIIVVTEAENNADVTVELNPESARLAAQNGIGLRVELPLGIVWIAGSDVKDVFGDTRGTVSFEISRNSDNTVAVQIKEGRNSVSSDGAFHSAILPLAFGRTSVSAGDVVYLVNADGSETLVRKSLVEGKYVYTLLDGSSVLRLRFNAKEFVDVKPENWFADAVDFASGHELFIGVSDTEFGPQRTMTRAMLVTVLYRLEDKPAVKGIQSFTDIAAGTWYTDAVEWASENGIVNGVGKGLYAPHADVTREQIATMLFRYAQHLGMDVSGRADLENKFRDGDQVSAWAKDAMQWAVKRGIFQGDDTGALNPRNNATRAEVATLMQRIVAMIVK